MEENDKVVVKDLFIEYAGDETVTLDDIADLLKSALHPVDVDELAAKLSALTCACECGNIVFDDDESCDKCNAEFATEEAEAVPCTVPA